jgi:cytochrome c biogenesis protein CcdA
MDPKIEKQICEADGEPAKAGRNWWLIGLIAAGLVFAGIVAFLRFSPAGTALLWSFSNGGKWLLPLVLVSALLDSINPCAFSVLLLTIAFLFSVGKLRSNMLKIGAVYIFGVFLVYILIGLGILQVLHLFNTPHFMAKFGAILLAVLGLINLINEYFPAFPIKLKIPSASHHAMAELMEKATFPTAFLLGVLVGICEFPCTGGPYLMILGLLHDQVTFYSGLMHLFLYNLIFVSPLAVILLVATEKSLFEKVGQWKKTNTRGMKLWSGIAMIILGIIIFFF